MQGFNNTGAVPSTSFNLMKPTNLSNPKSLALSNAQINFPKSPMTGMSVQNTSPTVQTSTPSFQGGVTGTNAITGQQTVQTPLQIHQGLIPGLLAQGGSHSTTGVDGSNSTIKVNPPPDVNPNAGMQTQGMGMGQAPQGTPQNTSINGGVNPFSAGPVITGNFPPGTPQNTPNQGNISTTPTDVTSTPKPAGMTFSGLLGGITGAGAKTEAEQRATADKIAQLKQNLQTETGIIQSQPQELNFQTGRVNALQTQEAAKEAALQGELQSEIAAGTQNIGAQESAAGLAQPTPAGYGQTVFNPITGQYSGGSSGVSPNDPFYATLQTYATQLANNQPASIPSSISGNPVLQAQLLQMTKAINPNFNYNTAQGIGAGQAQAGGNTVQYAQAVGKAIPVAQNLDNLIQTNNINPTDLTYANGAINWLKSNIGTPQQQASITEFNGQLNDLASTLAPALGVPGGATTDFKTSLGQSIVNGLQNGQSIQQSIQYFIQQAQQGALGAAAGAANPTGTLGGNNTTSGGLYSW